MIIQRRLEGGREKCFISVDPVVMRKLKRDSLRFDCSASFVGNTALATFFGIELPEFYYKAKRVKRNGRHTKRSRRTR